MIFRIWNKFFPKWENREGGVTYSSKERPIRSVRLAYLRAMRRMPKGTMVVIEPVVLRSKPVFPICPRLRPARWPGL
jgi:hypothetical protein